MKSTTALVLLAATLASTEANAQGLGLYTQTGWGAHLNVSSSEDATQIGLGATWMVGPTLELGLALSRAEIQDGDLAATGIGPFIGFYPVRQAEEMPVSLRVGAGYTFQSLSGDAIDALEDLGIEVDATGNAFLLTGAAFHALDATPRLRIVPFLEVGYVRQKTEVEASGLGGSSSDSDEEGQTYFGIGGGFQFLTSGNNSFVLTPGILFSDGNSSFGLTATLVIP